MILRKLRYFLRKFDHIVLLGSLLLFISSPIWEPLFGGVSLLNEVAVILIVIAGLSVTFSHKPNGINFLTYIGLGSIVLSALDWVVHLDEPFNSISQSIQIVFFLVLTVLLFQLIIRKNEVDSEVVINAINGYLLLGVSWAIIIALYSSFNPDSFSFVDKSNIELHDEVYYSFVTLTTLGYGDFLPLSPGAKMISILIAITGAFYSTIVLGMIVGKYISFETMKKNKG